MAQLDIIIAPDPRLKTRCTPIGPITAAVKQLAQDMLETMYVAPGIGLAAPQVGVMQRLVVLDVAGRDERPAPLVLVNPEIIWASDECGIYKEGCLSIPEAYADVQRPLQVRVRHIDLEGRRREFDADGLLATCVQHEIDHLDGVLFTDHLPAIRRNMIMTKMRKLKRERQRDAKRATE
jgi:peptide deformylase